MVVPPPLSMDPVSLVIGSPIDGCQLPLALPVSTGVEITMLENTDKAISPIDRSMPFTKPFFTARMSDSRRDAIIFFSSIDSP